MIYITTVFSGCKTKNIFNDNTESTFSNEIESNTDITDTTDITNSNSSSKTDEKSNANSSKNENENNENSSKNSNTAVSSVSSSNSSGTASEESSSSSSNNSVIPTNKKLTYAEYMKLTPADQQKYFETFASVTDFANWYNEAKENHIENDDSIQVGGNGTLDLNDFYK